MARYEYPQISVLVPTKDRFEVLGGCLDALARQDYPLSRVEMLICDDGGTDGTAEKAAALSGVFLSRGLCAFSAFRNEANLGIAAARARLTQKMSPDSEFALFLDDDLHMEPGCLRTLTEFMLENPRVGAVGPRVLAGYDRKRVMFAANFVGSWTGRYSSLDSESPLECDWLDPACLLVRRTAMDAAGSFDPGYYRSHEGADFCLRLKNSGHPPVYVPAALAVHHTRTPERPAGERLYYLYRNKFLVIHRNFTGARKIFSLLLSGLLGLPRHLAGSVFHRKAFSAGELRIICRAVWDGLLNRGGPRAA